MDKTDDDSGQPAAPAHVKSVYPKGVSGPGTVARWTREANAAESVEHATAQLVYELLLQVRTVKLILLWTMVIVPLAAVVLVLFNYNQIF